MKIQIRTKRPATDYEGFIDYLAQKYPITRLTKVFIDVIHTKNKRSSMASCIDYNGTTIVTIRLGAQYSSLLLLKTIAHEYCHVLQNDQNMEKSFCPAKDYAEIQADLFAARELHEYLNQPITEESSFAFENIYQVTKAYITQQGGLLNAINNPPQLREATS